jgi:hypothetical protein
LVQANATTLLQVIQQAATNPQVDIDKMERLMAMHERMQAREAETAWNEAMAACQRELRQVAPDAFNPQTKSRYATYPALDAVLRPVYARHDFSISFDSDASPIEECIRVIALVSRGGHTRTYKIDMPRDGKGAKGGDVMTKTHATGAGMQYGMRYLLKGIFNIAIGDLDNDGNGPTRPSRTRRARRSWRRADRSTACRKRGRASRRRSGRRWGPPRTSARPASKPPTRKPRSDPRF